MQGVQKGRHVRGVIPGATDCSRSEEKRQDERPSPRVMSFKEEVSDNMRSVKVSF